MVVFLGYFSVLGSEGVGLTATAQPMNSRNWLQVAFSFERSSQQTSSKVQGFRVLGWKGLKGSGL